MLVVLWRAWLPGFKTKMEWLIHLVISVMAFSFVFFAGTWGYLSFYLRWIFVPLYIYLLVMGYLRVSNKHWFIGHGMGWLGMLRRIVLIAIFGVLLFQLIKGNIYEEEAVNLQFPLRNGKFYIMQGGNSRISNLFHGRFSKSRYGYAMDIGKLNKWGNRGGNVFSEKLEDYEIFNDTVYAPCNGKVLKTLDTVRDNKPGILNTNPVHGNHIIIEFNNKKYRLYMVHLRKGSMMVKAGQKVKTGQPLALQGNSGFTIEPHMHIHVWKNFPEKEPFGEGTSVPILFEGKFYALNDIFNSKGKK
jgi:hypothetical protein